MVIVFCHIQYVLNAVLKRAAGAKNCALYPGTKYYRYASAQVFPYSLRFHALFSSVYPSLLCVT